MANYLHATSSVALTGIQRDGFRPGTYFMPVDKTSIKDMGGHAVVAAGRHGGLPILLTCDIVDDLLIDSPESLRRWFPQLHEKCARVLLPPSVIVDVDDQVFVDFFEKAKASPLLAGMFTGAVDPRVRG